jgi:molybdopterin molybdotransferase
MLQIGEAQRQVLEDIPVLGSERIHILESLGRVLAQDVAATRDVPTWDNSAMDGFAVKSVDVAGADEKSPIRLKIVGESPAGQPFPGSVGSKEAIWIMTGGIVPEGADTIVMVEHTQKEDNEVIVLKDPGPNAHIRRSGEDVKAGETVLHSGDLIRPPEVGMLATLGHGYVYVRQRPTVAILSTGDELVDIDQPFTHGKVVSSNSYSLTAQVIDCGAIPLSLGIATDDESDQRKKITAGIRADLIITSGGVSVGKYDLVKDTLSELGMKVKFWKVAMKPGKPLVFGAIGNKPVFGLPGNPTSAMISFEQFVRPAILKMMGHTAIFRTLRQVELAEEVRLGSDRLHLVRCRLFEKDGRLMAQATGTQSSGALRSMVLADAILILPAGKKVFAAGEKVNAQLLHTNTPLSERSPYE